MKPHTEKDRTVKLTFILIGLCSLTLLMACTEAKGPFIIGKPEGPQFIRIGPDESIIEALEHTVRLEVPNGAIDDPTTICIAYGDIIRVDSLHLMKSSVSISAGNGTLQKPVTITLLYNPEELGCMDDAMEMCLKIYTYPDCLRKISDEDWLECATNCVVDCRQNTIQATFSCLGTFVIGKPK
jgi:hypothetical protein